MAIYGATITKKYNGFTWVNGYRIDAVSLLEAAAAAGAIENYEVAFHYNYVQFIERRTWQLDTPSLIDFVSHPVAVPGELTPLGDTSRPIPQLALFVRLAPVFGRSGKKFYRYACQNFDAQGLGDSIETVGTPDVFAAYTEAATALTSALEDTGGSIVIGGTVDGTGARPVVSYVISGFAVLDTHHGWFNKSAPV